MPTEKKREEVAALRERITRCSIAIATDLRGLKGKELTDLRRKLREKGIEYRVVKNTLASLAAQEANRPTVQRLLNGPTALVLGYGDPTEPVRLLEEFVRSTRISIPIRGGVIDSTYLTTAEVNALLTLPSRERLVAQFIGQLKSPLFRLAGVLNTPPSQLVNILSAPMRRLTSVLQQRTQQLQKS